MEPIYSPVYEIEFLQSLIFTLSIEIICLWTCLRYLFKQKKQKYPFKQILGVGFLASFSSLPYVWFILPAFISNYVIYSITAEIEVFIYEALLYIFLLRVKPVQGFLLSLLCNGFSYGLGQLLEVIIK